MTQDNFVSFEEFREKALHTKKQTDADMFNMAVLWNAALGGEVVNIE